jgi:hypothetical protein
MGVNPDALYRTLLDDLLLEDPSRLYLLDDLPPDGTTRQAACHSLRKSLLKKFKRKQTREADNAALEKFLAINLKCEKWELQFADSWDEVLYGELRQAVYNFFHDQRVPILDSLDEFAHYGRTGPGASVGARGGDFYTKMFASPLTCTSLGLYESYRNYIRSFPEWTNAESIRTENYGSARVVEGNRLSFVPKDDKISRTICTEPSLNMFFQLGAGHVIERRLQSRYGISMSTQPFKNRELARKGSLGLGFVTCDLSSASDSLSLKMLKGVLPKHVFDMLRLLRSASTSFRGVRHDLHMISTMGNGFTFPLQTMLFASIVMAAFSARGIKPLYPRGNDCGNFGVFGDDIICPDEIWPDVRRLLRLLGFSINHDKTFVEGPFRESCGADFHLGIDIRGVYVKTLDSQQDLFAVVNQLNLFSTRTGIKLSKTVQLLFNRTDATYVPRWDDLSAGICVPFALVSRTFKLDRNCQSIAYRRYEPVGLKIRVGEHAIFVPKVCKPRLYNPSGLLISFLQRSINSYTIGVRHDIVRYKRKLGISPNWDKIPMVHPLKGWFPWWRWDTAVYLNLFG